ncbi:argininosuccinate synthase [Slackia piriformis]|uniref:Argininosuccinate synthase n=1 Tax=Slackia piriformis YIT 12062 TaxID=742818 RepID=K0Z7B5_9ACTN|nr:argininosuccinate synthase [Slackia piriformis]EJZ83325.1 argininosuccinate synthase [Slackia piriformis YIT 12062]
MAQAATKEKVVLAYSGGLDTSVCLKWLQAEKGFDVIAVCGNVGQDENDLAAIKQKAIDMGAVASFAVDMREEYANEYVTLAIAANGLYENSYPLLSALSRPLLSKHMVEVAHAFGAKYVAHGCTGKGNDQVRFETSIKALDPSIEIIAPVREWNLHSREEEMEWAKAHGVPVPTTKKSPYSIDDNLWGRAIECGVLEDPWCEPPAGIWTLTADAQSAPDQPEYLEIGFESGVPCSLNGEEMGLVDMIKTINVKAGLHGCGRLDMVENRLVGVKSRECYEVPAAQVIINAHKALETLCLDRETQHYKFGIEQKWATAVYEGLWYSPLKEALDSFCASTQACVTGTVKVKLYKGSSTVVGRKSPYSLYDFGLASYGAQDTFDHEAAKGFIQLHGLPTTVWSAKQGPAAKEMAEQSAFEEKANAVSAA